MPGVSEPVTSCGLRGMAPETAAVLWDCTQVALHTYSNAPGLAVLSEHPLLCFTRELYAVFRPFMSRVLSEDSSPLEKTFKRL